MSWRLRHRQCNSCKNRWTIRNNC